MSHWIDYLTRLLKGKDKPMTGDYPTVLKITSPDGTEKTLTGTLTDSTGNGGGTQPPSSFAIDFSANFNAFSDGHNMMSTAEWEKVFKQGVDQGVGIYCLEDNTDATRHDFFVKKGGRNGGNCMRVFMPRGSYGMGHRSVQLKLKKVNGPVNVAFDFMVEDPGINLWTQGGGKWGPAIQYGPIQSGTTGGIRQMPTWAAGQSTLGKQDLTFSIQNQPDGGQWLQPPYYGFRPIEYNHWYDVHLRMTGGGGPALTGTLPAQSVRCQFWKDTDPMFDYQANTNNSNAQQNKADVFIDWTCFFGGGEANKAPADAYFRYGEKFRVWVEA